MGMPAPYPIYYYQVVNPSGIVLYEFTDLAWASIKATDLEIKTGFIHTVRRMRMEE